MIYVIRFIKELKEKDVIYYNNMIMRRKDYKDVEPYIANGSAVLEQGKKPSINKQKKK
jgi:hypothetical protein|tara:strand:+ start:377 stop:550 length:174 start_codon:yes stop_codon:yes gene_type:complete